MELKIATIKKLKKEDIDPKRPASEQLWGLYSQKDKLLGRHPSKESAMKQMRLVEMKKHSKRIQAQVPVGPRALPEINPNAISRACPMCGYSDGDGLEVEGGTDKDVCPKCGAKKVADQPFAINTAPDEAFLTGSGGTMKTKADNQALSDLEKQLKDIGLNDAKIREITEPLKGIITSTPDMVKKPDMPQEPPTNIQTPTTSYAPPKVSQPVQEAAPGKPMRPVGKRVLAQSEGRYSTRERAKGEWVVCDNIYDKQRSGVYATEKEALKFADTDSAIEEALVKHEKEPWKDFGANKKMAYEKDLIRDVKLSKDYRLKLYDIFKTDNMGKSRLAYELISPKGEVIFSGDDFSASPMHGIDSDETIKGLLSFLTLRRGDTDEDYFKDYTKEQLDFSEGDAEELSLHTLDEDHLPFEDIEEDKKGSSKKAVKKLAFIDKYLAVWDEPPTRDPYAPPPHLADATDEEKLEKGKKEPKEKTEKILDKKTEKKAPHLLHVVEVMFDKGAQYELESPEQPKKDPKGVGFSSDEKKEFESLSDPEEGSSGKAKSLEDFEIDAKAIGEKIGIKWEEVDFTPEQLQKGIEVELEHGTINPETNVTDDDLEITAKIAWAHLNEKSNYYELLAKMEQSSEEAPKEQEETVEEEQDIEAENLGGAIEDTTTGDTKLY